MSYLHIAGQQRGACQGGCLLRVLAERLPLLFLAAGWDHCACLRMCTCNTSLPMQQLMLLHVHLFMTCTCSMEAINRGFEDRMYRALQANLEAAKFQLADEDYEELSQLKHQQRSVPASGFLKEGGPYKKEEDVWEAGWPNGI
jgi:hypothetical protein